MSDSYKNNIKIYAGYFNIHTRNTLLLLYQFSHESYTIDMIDSCYLFHTLSIAGIYVLWSVYIDGNFPKRERKTLKAMGINSDLFAGYYRWCINESASTRCIAFSIRTPPSPFSSIRSHK